MFADICRLTSPRHDCREIALFHMASVKDKKSMSCTCRPQRFTSVRERHFLNLKKAMEEQRWKRQGMRDGLPFLRWH